MTSWMTPEEAAEELHVSVYTIRRYCYNHKLPAIPIGRDWRINVPELQKLALANLSPDEAQRRGRLRKEDDQSR